MLRVIVSPAKKMRAGAESPMPLSTPALVGRSAELLESLLGMDASERQALWKVSDRLLGPCLDTLEALREVGLPASGDDLARPGAGALVSPAVLAYHGIQYQSMAPEVMSAGELAWVGEHLRILSGLYGCLRPFDAVVPYRLEMGARLPPGHSWPGGARDLYAFWGDGLAREVCAQEGDTADGGAPVHVVNLASVEYAKAVLPRLSSGVRVTSCVFAEDLRGGKPVQRSTASKAARGSMVRWLAAHGADVPAELEGFDVGYRYASELSSGEGTARRTLVFVRS